MIEKLIFNLRGFYDLFSFPADLTKYKHGSLGQKQLH